MKAENINPFLEAVSETFENMLGCSVTTGEPSVDNEPESQNTADIIGLIGLSGTAQGIVAIRFPVTTALRVVGTMIGTEFKGVDSSIIDGVGELVNIIAGSAKTKLEGHKIALSLPSVLRGSLCRLNNLNNAVWLSLPFVCDLGEFNLMISFKPAVVPKKEGVNACANSR